MHSSTTNSYARQDDQVEELEIDPNEDQGHEDTDVDDLGDGQDVISINSDDEEKQQREQDPTFLILDRPWKVQGFNHDMRHHWETMYCTVQQGQVSQSWDMTEEYQHEKDKEMLRYMEDFPLPTWVISKDLAEQAFFRLIERMRWRSMGIRIYGDTRIPEMIPNSTPSRTMPGPPGSGHMPQHAQMPHHPNHYSPRPSDMVSSGAANGRPDMMVRGTPNNVHPPPPQQTLRSQPNAMPMGVPPGPHPQQQTMRGPPHGMLPPGMHPAQLARQTGVPSPNPGSLNVPMSHMPQDMPYAVPPHLMNYTNVPHLMMAPASYVPRPPPGMQHAPMPQQAAPTSATKKRREKKETPPPASPPPPPPTPPYPVRSRPMPRKEFNKSGRKNMRKQAEALEFPWQRKMDFNKARAESKWDDSGYDTGVLDDMAMVREKNMPVITKLDDDLAEKQRKQRIAPQTKTFRGLENIMLTALTGNQRNKRKKGQTGDDEDGSDDESKKPEGEEQKTARKNANIGGDPYYSGNYSFATEADLAKALALQRRTPDEIIEAAQENKIDWDLCKDIYICWNPGKKGLTQDLEQAKFRIYDTLITRKQLKDTPILDRRAAECIVDFCPDLLWRETLLRIVSEAGYGNKDVRDRFCYNGCHNDKATVTKRIAAALGQKQIAGPRTKAREDALQLTEEENTAAAEAEAAEATARAESAGEGSGQAGGQRKRGPSMKENKDRYYPGEEAWHEANKVDFANYIQFFGKRPGTRVWHAGEKRKHMSDAENAAMERDDNEDGEGVSSMSPGKKIRGNESASTTAGDARDDTAEVEDSDAEVENSDQGDAVSEQPDSVLGDSDDGGDGMDLS